MIRFSKFFSAALAFGWLFAATSCELTKPDELPDPTAENLEVEAAFETPEVIDLTEGLNLSGAATIRLITPPATGTLEMIGETFALYTPGALTQNHEDSFVLEVTQGQQRIRRAYRMIVRQLNQRAGSRGIAVYDRGGVVAPGAIDTTDVLANDLIPPGATITRLGVVVPPLKGRAVFNSANQLIYKADSTASGLDQLVYGVQLANGARGQALVKFLIQ